MLTQEELAMLQAIRASGSLSKAAAHLGKAPSTLSHAARQLEDRYDALLFDRRRYRLQLTPAGQLLAEEAERLLHDMGRLNTRVRQIASGWEDRLHIVTDELFEFQTLLPLIADFDKLQSGVGLRITHEVLGGTWHALRGWCKACRCVDGAASAPVTAPAPSGPAWPTAAPSSPAC